MHALMRLLELKEGKREQRVQMCLRRSLVCMLT